MLTLVCNLLLFVFALILIIIIASIAGMAIVFVGALIEEGQGNDYGFFHRILDVISDNI